MIKLQNIRKDFKGVRVLKSLNLSVESGEIYGFLGPNGAGKTTTILLILGILKPTRGRIFVLGEDIRDAEISLRKRIGVVSEKQYLYRQMTILEYLDFFGDLYRVNDRKKQIDRLLECLDLSPARNKRIGTLSRGMQQKLGFAKAFLHDPELLILDEPISGLDPMGIRQVRDLIVKANITGKTIFISSHLLSEVERLCSKVGIINKGKLLAEEAMIDLKRKLTDTTELEVEVQRVPDELIPRISSLEFVKEVSSKDNFLQIQVESDQDYRAGISGAIAEAGGLVLSIQTKEISLEEAFMNITSQNIPWLTVFNEKNEG